MKNEHKLRNECDDKTMSSVMQAMEGPVESALALLNRSLADCPLDYRLWFLRGATLASQQRHDEARLDLLHVQELAPGFHVATFMLGFLEFINAGGTSANATWALLDELAENDPLRVLKDGLVSLARGDFDVSLRQLDRGLSLNQQYPLLNSYIQAVISRTTELSQQSTVTTDTQAPRDHLLLSGYQGSQTRH